MKKVISILAALCIILGTAVSAAGFGEPITFIKNPEPHTLTPTGGVLLEEGEINNIGRRLAIRLFSSGSQQTFDEYLREQLINHATTISLERFRIPVSEFPDKFLAFIFCNSDLPIRAAYTGGISFTENGVEYMQSINPVYVYDTKEECDRKYVELDTLTTSLAEYASKGKTELEKALFLFDKISLDYYYTPGETFEKINYTPYSFLDNGHGVCQGYAILYKLCLEKLGIESYLCENYNPSINHAWNYIKIDGNWYHADPTWSYYSDAPQMVSRKYFLLSDSGLANDGKHGVKEEWIVQRNDIDSINCTSNEYEKGYLFHELAGVPVYRDNKSLFLNYDVLLSATDSLSLTLRSDTLKAYDVIFAEPDIFDGEPKASLLTLNAVNTPVHIVVAGYEAGGKFADCEKLTADSLPSDAFMQFPTFGLDAKGDTIKWMLLSASTLSPVTYYSEMTIANQGN